MTFSIVQSWHMLAIPQLQAALLNHFNCTAVCLEDYSSSNTVFSISGLQLSDIMLKLFM